MPNNLGAPPVAIGPVYAVLVELMIPLPFPDMPELEVATVSVAEDSRLSAEGDVAAAAVGPIEAVALVAAELK